MKIGIIGSTQYKDKFINHKAELEKEGHIVRIPAFDDIKGGALDVCQYNLDMINWADRIDIIWDNRSVGFIFDMGMVFALKKPIKIVYVESKTFYGLIKEYEHFNN